MGRTAMTCGFAKAVALGCISLTLASGALAQQSDGSLPRGDVKFLQKAAAHGMAEVEFGRMAQQQAMREDVKQFATRMVEDHGKANEELKKVAAAHRVQLRAGPTRRHQKAMDRLAKKIGPDFDREYMRHMVKDHKKDVNEFREHAQARHPNDVTRFAAATLPTLVSHLQAAQGTYDITLASQRSGDRVTGSTQK